MITVIDYGVGNLGSVANALRTLNVTFEISNKKESIEKAEKLILPGVGNAKEGMKNLKKLKLDKTIIKQIKRGKPILGICLGMQLLFEKSEEGNVKCLGLIQGSVRKFRKEKKIPQIGWNQTRIKNYESRIMNSIKNNDYFYFVNSYVCKPVESSISVGETEYGETFCSAVEKENIFGVQFHPEKSGTAGFQLLKNFINVC